MHTNILKQIKEQGRKNYHEIIKKLFRNLKK